MRKFWLRIVVSICIGILYFLYLFYSEEAYLPSILQNFPHVIISIAIAISIGLSLYFSDKQLNKLLPWKENLPARFIVGLVANILITISLIAILGGLYYGFINESFSVEWLWLQHQEPIIKLLIITVIAVLLYSLIYFALYSYNQYAVAQLSDMQEQRKHLKLQLEALKSQLSPHYLFNSLNTISSLIFKDADLAEDFIRRLALTYQYILDNNKRQFVTLDEEVEFVKSYNYLLKVRFENHLHLEINLPKNIMSSAIPPLTLQMLVENAVKHNLINKNNPLYIYISAIDNTNISICNTKTVTPSHVKSFKVGLKNIKQRYRLFTSAPIKVTDSAKFTVTLPVLKGIEL
ncbi:sensor histidine kinase [Fulvivirga sediminis]|uniref:Histidine kinase n=1 Tax=Fulvivirga sediminis TaxID=2803949 RepID=A0A937F5T9_9BACT|nr:histidine kinase [Fulvivirga sediminis]MBL3655507.1 histidine kinase [Fulvivirga sediminis]